MTAQHPSALRPREARLAQLCTFVSGLSLSPGGLTAGHPHSPGQAAARVSPTLSQTLWSGTSRLNRANVSPSSLRPRCTGSDIIPLNTGCTLVGCVAEVKCGFHSGASSHVSAKWWKIRNFPGSPRFWKSPLSPSPGTPAGRRPWRDSARPVPWSGGSLTAPQSHSAAGRKAGSEGVHPAPSARVPGPSTPPAAAPEQAAPPLPGRFREHGKEIHKAEGTGPVDPYSTVPRESPHKVLETICEIPSETPRLC